MRCSILYFFLQSIVASLRTKLGFLVPKWMLIADLPTDTDHMWKSWTQILSPYGAIAIISLKSSSESISGGAPSIRTLMHLLMVGDAVVHTIIENTKVQIGSMIYQVGKKKITVAAMQTPTLINISPRTCKYAA